MKLRNIPVGLQLYSVRESLEADFKGTLEKVKAMGYSGVEFADLYGNDPKEVKKWLTAIGLVPVSAHIPLDDMIADPEKTIGAYKEIGCTMVAMPWLAAERRPGQPMYDETVAAIEKLAAYCKANDMKLVYHNHDFEFVKPEGSDEYCLDIMYNQIPDLYAELDLCWVKVAGEDPVKYIKKYADRSPIIHYKDFYMPGKKAQNLYKLIGTTVDEVEDDAIFEFRPIGYGQQSWMDITDAVVDAKIPWIIVEQDEPTLNMVPLDCVKKSLDYIATL